MKKFLATLAVLVLALALVACGGEVADTTEPVTEAPETEHVHNYVDDITPATCSAEGKIVSKCECGVVQSETAIPLTDHTASALDCEKDTVCTVCNTVLAEKTGHIFGASEIVTAATCSTAGKEKGSCVSCGKIVETEIPAAGHIAGTDIKAVDGGFSSTCKTCGQAVTLKADKTVFALSFDEDVNAEAAKYADAGLSLCKTDTWKIEDGTLKVTGPERIAYIDIEDPSKLAALGTFMITFDYTTTSEAPDTANASVFSLLSNFYNSKTNYQGTTGWGWFFKLVESKNVFAPTTSVDKINDSNSVAVERNTKYTVQAVVDPTDKVAHVFINGKYIGNAGTIAKIADLKPATACFRLGDGPVCGHVYDNFAIIDLK